MFNLYYQTDSPTSFFRELGREFSEANRSSPICSRKGRRPGRRTPARRLRCLLTAPHPRTDRRRSAGTDRVAHALLVPHYLRTLPATSIVQFTPNQNALRSRDQRAQGTELGSPARSRARRVCSRPRRTRFGSLSIENVELDQSSPTARRCCACTSARSMTACRRCSSRAACACI